MTATIEKTETKKMFINGKFCDAVSGKTFDTVNPSTEEVICQVAAGDKADVDLAVKAARKAFETGAWPKMAPQERAALIWKLSDLIEKNSEELARLETLDNGKPLKSSKGDVAGCVDYFRYFAGWATKIEGSTISISGSDFEHHAFTMPEPVGVVGQIVPWNYPLAMATWKIAPALACGCTCVLKPAEQTPLTAIRLAELIQEAGFPDGVVNIVTGLGETAGAAIASHPDIDKVAFTGSTEVGKMIVKAATGNLKKVSLELGGNSPNIVLDDCDLEETIPGAAQAIFANQGQNCCAGARLLIQEAVFDRVVEGIAKIANDATLGDGFDSATTMGPLISKEHFDRVMGYLESGKSDGAKAVCGGGRQGSRGYFVQPTVFTNTKKEMKIVCEEIFGPVVTAIPFKTVDEAVAMANDTEYGLASGVWTKDISKAHKIAKRLKAGTVWVNCYNAVHPAVPFGGFKESGWGREMGRKALDLYTENKSVVMRL